MVCMRRISEVTACFILISLSVAHARAGSVLAASDPLPEIAPEIITAPLAHDSTVPEAPAAPLLPPESILESPLPSPPAVLSTEASLTPESAEGSRSSVEAEVPIYSRVTPRYSFGVEFTSQALGSNSNVIDLGAGKLRGFTLHWEYQPESIQKYGVLAFGPLLSVYPATQPGGLSPASGVTDSFTSIFSYGMQIRYQLIYFKGQPIVPEVGYRLEYLRYAVNGKPSGGFLISGPMVGVMVLLNGLEPPAASAMYADNGICRTYLVAEGWSATGSDVNTQVSGQSLFFGLRFEL